MPCNLATTCYCRYIHVDYVLGTEFLSLCYEVGIKYPPPLLPPGLIYLAIMLMYLSNRWYRPYAVTDASSSMARVLLVLALVLSFTKGKMQITEYACTLTP